MLRSLVGSEMCIRDRRDLATKREEDTKGFGIFKIHRSMSGTYLSRNSTLAFHGFSKLAKKRSKRWDLLQKTGFTDFFIFHRTEFLQTTEIIQDEKI